MSIELIERDIEELCSIEPLWRQLNEIHKAKSVNFGRVYEYYTFEKRMEGLIAGFPKGKQLLNILINTETNEDIGYCLSTIEDGAGEIESIFIKPEYRRQHLGERLMNSALAWFDLNSVRNITIGVVYGNDEALPFYRHCGFDVSVYLLRRSVR